MTGSRPRGSRVFSLEAAGVAVAILSLAVALVYNGRQLGQTRQATQLELLTSLDAELNDSVARLWKHERELVAVQVGDQRFLSSTAKLDVDRAFAYMEYLAWLFNADFVSLADAQALWGPEMACRYEHVLLPTGGSAHAVAHDYPNLTAFVSQYRPCDE